MLVLLYWITVIVGAFDFEFLDFDLDVADSSGPIYAILSFLNVAELPFMLVFSMLILNFWIIAMLIYYLPIAAGGLLNGILLIPALVISVFITKCETLILNRIFKSSNKPDIGNEVIEKQCILKCDVKNGQLGQAEIKRDGASIVINVKSEYEGVSFRKEELAFVIRKDIDKNLYYIIKKEGVIK